ncbi:MAG: MscL family protein [Minisyncoccia bacterium]
MNPEAAKGALEGFMTFIREQGVVGLATAVILGGAVGKVVSSLVADIVMPVVALTLGSADGVKSLSMYGVMYGNFVSTIIDFAIIAAVVYFGIKGLGLDKMDKKKA